MTAPNFILDSILLNDTHYIGKLSLCRVLLMNNKLFPWVILVPERNDIKEIYQLPEKDQKTLIKEISLISKTMQELYWPDKMNIAALGNVVEQLHVHIIARFKTDDVWPEPVWGKGTEAYDHESALEVAEKIRGACNKIEGFTTIANQP